MSMVPEAAAVTSPASPVSPIRPPAHARQLPWGWGLVAALVLALVIAPLMISDYHTLILTKIVFYAVAIMGLNLLTGFSGQISLGNGAFWALGSYTSVILIAQAGVPYWATPPVAAVVCFVVGYLFGRTATRLEGHYLALATFGLAITTPQVLKLNALEKWTGGSQGVVFSKPESPVAALSNDQWLYYFCFAIALVLFVLAWNIIRGRAGRALIALRDHPIAAGTMGIDTAFYRAMAFGISAMFTGIAGALDAFTAGYIGPDSFPLALSVQLLVGGVVGGIASIFGTLFGGAFIQLVPDVAKQFSDNAPAVLYGILLVVFMMVMPGGVAGLIYRIRAWLAIRQRTRT